MPPVVKESTTHLFLFCTMAWKCLRASSISSAENLPVTIVPCTCTFLVSMDCRKNHTDAVLGKDKLVGFMPNNYAGLINIGIKLIKEELCRNNILAWPIDPSLGRFLTKLPKVSH